MLVSLSVVRGQLSVVSCPLSESFKELFARHARQAGTDARLTTDNGPLTTDQHPASDICHLTLNIVQIRCGPGKLIR